MCIYAYMQHVYLCVHVCVQLYVLLWWYVTLC